MKSVGISSFLRRFRRLTPTDQIKSMTYAVVLFFVF